MELEFNMSTHLQLVEAVARLKAQGIDALIGQCGLVYPHVLAISGVGTAQEALVRGLVLQIDPHAERVPSD